MSLLPDEPSTPPPTITITELVLVLVLGLGEDVVDDPLIDDAGDDTPSPNAAIVREVGSSIPPLVLFVLFGLLPTLLFVLVEVNLLKNFK